MKTYAIADLHGRYDMLEKCLSHIHIEALKAGSNDFDVYFLGDYVDRGPDSRKILERLMDGPSAGEGRWHFLMGNHEAMMIAAMQGDQANFRGWMLNGGDKTLLNYVLDPPEMVTQANARYLKLDDAAMDRTMAFLMNDLKLVIDDGHRLFVHALVNHNAPLDDPSQQEWFLWQHVRKNHAERPYRDIFGRQVVHGHSPQRGAAGPFVSSDRVNLDMGSVFGGPQAIAEWSTPEQALPDITLIR